ncbi:hypothetical protein GDO78_002980 [Eleutherodactylus coqui]|uniref:Uncharacterized protein n=1 Tax=Eleutherodactylus coqui TaxID=57060 RepID=A0A8J6K1L3_ELECQ|nr:hypothetical protein GDO78_002980 [Eleutherodactylus coqui]
MSQPLIMTQSIMVPTQYHLSYPTFCNRVTVVTQPAPHAPLTEWFLCLRPIPVLPLSHRLINFPLLSYTLLGMPPLSHRPHGSFLFRLLPMPPSLSKTTY